MHEQTGFESWATHVQLRRSLMARLVRYDVEAWIQDGYADTVRESIERALAAEQAVEDFGVDVEE